MTNYIITKALLRSMGRSKNKPKNSTWFMDAPLYWQIVDINNIHAWAMVEGGVYLLEFLN